MSEQVPLHERYPQYYRKCGYEYVDVYRVLEIFGVTNPCLQHAIKKLLLAGVRTGKKDFRKDIKEAIDALTRALAMIDEVPLGEKLIEFTKVTNAT